MAWTNPLTWVTNQVVTAAQLNAHVRDNMLFLKGGVATSDIKTAALGPTSGTTELTLATVVPPNFDGSTLVRVEFTWYGVTLSTAGDVFVMRVYDGSTQIGGAQVTSGNVNAAGGICRAWVTPTAGSHTFTARIVRGAGGAGTATIVASSLQPAILSVSQAN